MILWKVEVLIDDEWFMVATGVRFDYYDTKACREHIRKNCPEIYEKVKGTSWDVKVEKWT